jgi:hypothetical protein
MNNNTNNESSHSLNSISTSRSGLYQFVVGEGVDLDNLLQINRFHELQDIINQANVTSSNDHHHQQQDQLATNNNQSMYRTNIIRSNSNQMHSNTHSHSHAPNDQTTTSNNQVVLDLASNNNSNNQTSNESADGNQQLQPQPLQDQNIEGNAANGFFMLLMKTMQSSLPFFVILVAKIFHQHLLGFFIVLGFMTTLHWSNRTLVNQIQLKVIFIFFICLNYNAIKTLFSFKGKETKP